MASGLDLSWPIEWPIDEPGGAHTQARETLKPRLRLIEQVAQSLIEQASIEFNLAG